MPDRRLVDLPEDTSPLATDLLYTVHDPGGTPADKKAQIGHLPFATIAYVDAATQGLTFKSACRLATAAALPANTYLAGVLTGAAPGALSVDGSAVVAGDRILVKNEATAANNGIYVVTVAGSGGTAYVLTRASDMDTAAEFPGAATQIDAGSTLAATGWAVFSQGPFVVGVTAVNWTETVGSYLAKASNLADVVDAPTALANLGGEVRNRALNAPVNDYTLVLGDAIKHITPNKASAIAVTVPPNSSVAFPIETRIPFTNLGAGVLTLTAGEGVTLSAPAGLTIPQFGSGWLTKIATDTWVVQLSVNATSVAPSQLQPYKVGWYSQPFGLAAATNISTEGDLFLTAFEVPKACSIDRIACFTTVGGGTGALVRLGIYNSDSDGMPSTLLLDAGTVDATATGVLAKTISQALTPGLVWLAAVVQGAASPRPTCAVPQNKGDVRVLGGNNTWNQYPAAGYTKVSVSGALPGSFAPDAVSGAPISVAVRFA